MHTANSSRLLQGVSEGKGVKINPPTLNLKPCTQTAKHPDLELYNLHPEPYFPKPNPQFQKGFDVKRQGVALPAVNTTRSIIYPPHRTLSSLSQTLSPSPECFRQGFEAKQQKGARGNTPRPLTLNPAGVPRS